MPVNSRNKYTQTCMKLRLSDVLERQGHYLNLLSKLVIFLITEKHFVVLKYLSAPLKVLEQL